MQTFKDFNTAQKAAELFFNENFGHKSGVGIESASGYIVEFYSKEDPSMDDTFFCRIESSKLYHCHNGGPVQIEYI